MNLEDFFISEYEKLKDENKRLKEDNASLNRKIAELPKPPEAASLLDARIVGADMEAVKVICASSWMLQSNCFKGKPSSYLEEKKADIANAEKWPAEGYMKPLDVKRERFAAVVAVKVLSKEREYLVRGNCEIEKLYDSTLSMWCPAEQEAELVGKARKALLDEMDKAIDRLKEKEAKERHDAQGGPEAA